MRWRARVRTWRPVCRRLGTGITLVAYFATAVGFPLGASPRKIQGQPFPCQDHPCGCRTAEDCWRHCCCYSPEERLAWAESHRVQPPPYAERPSTHGWHELRLRDRAEACSACSQQVGPKAQRPGSKDCCSGKAKAASCRSCHAPLTKTCSSKEKTGSRSPTTIGVLRCQGFSTLWVHSGTVPPPNQAVAWTPSLTPTGWLPGWNAFAQPIPVAPPDPPPRFSGV
jgi:hypothetical protein